MKFQLCSDIKIRSLSEGKNFAKYLKPIADILLICGNIISQIIFVILNF